MISALTSGWARVFVAVFVAGGLLGVVVCHQTPESRRVVSAGRVPVGTHNPPQKAPAPPTYSLKLLDVVDQDCLPERNCQVTCIAFSSDGKSLASGEQDVDWRGHRDKPSTVKVFDPPTGRVLRSFHVGDVDNLSYSFTGRTLVARDSVTWKNRRLDIRTGRVLRSFKEFPSSPGGDSRCRNSTLFADLLPNGTIDVRDGGTRKLERELFSPDAPEVTDYAISPRGRFLAAACAERPDQYGLVKVKLWDLQSRHLDSTLLSVRRDDGEPTFLFSPDERTLVVESSVPDTDTNAEDLTFWDTETARLVGTHSSAKDEYGGCGEFHHMTFSPDGTLFASSCYHGPLLVWKAVRR